MTCLRQIRNLFGAQNPFYAGFGNRITDAMSYRSVNIPVSRICTIDSAGKVKLELLQGYNSSYVEMNDLVDFMFPQLSSKIDPKYNDWEYWKAPLPNVDIDFDEIARKEDAEREVKGSKQKDSNLLATRSHLTPQANLGPQASTSINTPSTAPKSTQHFLSAEGDFAGAIQKRYSLSSRYMGDEHHKADMENDPSITHVASSKAKTQFPDEPTAPENVSSSNKLPQKPGTTEFRPETIPETGSSKEQDAINNTRGSSRSLTSFISRPFKSSTASHETLISRPTTTSNSGGSKQIPDDTDPIMFLSPMEQARLSILKKHTTSSLTNTNPTSNVASTGPASDLGKQANFEANGVQSQSNASQERSVSTPGSTSLYYQIQGTSMKMTDYVFEEEVEELGDDFDNDDSDAMSSVSREIDLNDFPYL